VLLDQAPVDTQSFVALEVEAGAQPAGLQDGVLFCAKILDGDGSTLNVDPDDDLDDDEPLELRWDQVRRFEVRGTCP
jgi:hypothetical protein